MKKNRVIGQESLNKRIFEWFSNRAVIFILSIFILWQIGLTLISLVSPALLPLKINFAYREKIAVTPPIFWSRANFDGIHYLHISRLSYGVYQQAFFPGYPSLVKKITPLFGGQALTAAVFVSTVSLLVFLYLFYRLIRLDYQESTARRAIVLFMLFPTAFFLGAVYGESLFLALVMGSFYAARQKKWWLAGLLGAFSSYVRVVGVLLLPALLWEWYEQTKDQKWSEKLPGLSFLAIIPVGILAYMKYLWETYGDPLMFLRVQPYFGAGRSGGKIILLYQVFWRYLKMMLTTKLDLTYFIVWLEVLTAVGFLFLLFLAYKKRVRVSYLVFSLLAFLLPTLSGTFSSLPRYVLVLFPCFIYLGTVRNKFLYSFLGVLFGILLLVCSILFYQGYWVS